MIHKTSAAIISCGLLCLPAISLATQRTTPVLGAFEHIEDPSGSTLHILVEPDRGGGWRLGIAFQCRGRGQTLAAAFLGPFPPDRRPVQLAVRTPDGTIERFGDVLSGGPESGFNDTYIEEAADQRRFARAALQQQALVSNGYNSFWNGAPAEANRQVLAELTRCRR